MSTLDLIDIGVNLTHRQFARDLQPVIDRATAAGVRRMILTGTSIRESRAAAKLAECYPGTLFSTAGVHPHDARHWDTKSNAQLKDLVALNQVVAIGECGLDYNRDFSPRPQQRRVFEQQLKLAAELKLPVFLHERDAHEDFINILEPFLNSLAGAVVHCFTGSEDELDRYIIADLHIGITGWICDERRGKQLLHMLPRIPLQRLMVETDAPFLLPRDLPGKPSNRRNEPAFLPWIVQRIAKAYKKEPREIAELTTHTAEVFFQLS